MVSNLGKTTSLAKADNFVYVHFSGHGTTCEPFKYALNLSIEGMAPVPSKFSNPSTGDLALVVLEATTEIETRYLRGEELGSLIKRMVDKGLIVTLVLDCRFSGSVMRDDSSVRHVRYDPHIDTVYPPASGLSDEGKASRTIYRNASMRSNWLVDPGGYTILAACGPAEIAKEIVFNGQKRGALSYLLLKTLNSLSYVGCKQLHIYLLLCASFRKAQEQFPNKRIPNPMFYGNKTLGFFGYTCVVLSPFEAHELLPSIRRHNVVTLHVYSPRVSISGRTLEDLSFCVIPATLNFFRHPLFLILLNLFAGQLYLRSYEEYISVCRFLGLGFRPPDEQTQVASDGFISSKSRPAFDAIMERNCPFTISPVGFLRILMTLRRKGQSFQRSHLGRILHGGLLAREEFQG